MTIIGMLYLSFEDFALADFSSINGRPSTKVTHPYGRTVTGVQIGLMVLSMIVTRSSALSIQAKQGLPFGNQIVGWTVLGQ